MIKVIVVGGGWSGCAAALAAAKAGAQVSLLERTDMLLGTGLVGGIFRNNGRYTAAEEAIAMGGGELFVAMDANARHRGIEFPGHKHASLYDVTVIEPAIRKILQDFNVDIQTKHRITGVTKCGKKLASVTVNNQEMVSGDVFVDATGSAGPMGNCLKYGNGCAMCALRCPSFGPRVSVTSQCEVKEIYPVKKDGTLGAMSGSCKLNKESLSVGLRETLERDGVAVIPLPAHLNKAHVLGKKACVQYALTAFAENLILLDTGHAKMMTPFFPLNDLRTIPGLENARYEDPYAGGIGNSMRYLGIAPNSNILQVDGMDNLFCAGEKSGLLVGHTEAVVTGLLSGHNAVRYCLDMKYLELSPETASGDFIAYVHEQAKTPEGRVYRYSFSGSLFFERMKEKNLYSINQREIRQRIAQSGLADIYNSCLV